MHKVSVRWGCVMEMGCCQNLWLLRASRKPPRLDSTLWYYCVYKGGLLKAVEGTSAVNRSLLHLNAMACIVGPVLDFKISCEPYRGRW